jgi:tetrahedral aminopeptidase
MLQTFRRLAEIPGGSGFEEKVIEFMATELRKHVSDVSIDPLGNVIAATGLGSRSLMVCAHTDEMCMLVKYIDDRGNIYFELNGMFDQRVLPSTAVDVSTRNGTYTGVVGAKSRHGLSEQELEEAIHATDLWIDVGAESAEEAMSWGIDVGDPIVFHPHFFRLGKDTIISKAVDDRVGCALLIDLAARISREQLDYRLLLVAAAQEEVGSRGARVAAQTLAPDAAVVVDTVPASDPATPLRQATVLCGKGPAIRTMDVHASGRGTLYSKKIRDRLIATAQRHGIAHQKDVARTWTDASAIHTSGAGIPCGGVYIPRRHSHSPLEVVKWRDVEGASELIYFFLKELCGAGIEDLIRKL